MSSNNQPTRQGSYRNAQRQQSEHQEPQGNITTSGVEYTGHNVPQPIIDTSAPPIPGPTSDTSGSASSVYQGYTEGTYVLQGQQGVQPYGPGTFIQSQNHPSYSPEVHYGHPTAEFQIPVRPPIHVPPHAHPSPALPSPNLAHMPVRPRPEMSLSFGPHPGLSVDTRLSPIPSYMNVSQPHRGPASAGPHLAHGMTSPYVTPMVIGSAVSPSPAMTEGYFPQYESPPQGGPALVPPFLDPMPPPSLPSGSVPPPIFIPSPHELSVIQPPHLPSPINPLPTSGRSSVESPGWQATPAFPPQPLSSLGMSPPLAPSTGPIAGPSRRPGPGPSGKSERDKSTGAKTSRQQFTACGACRHRRVKCDLKDRQEEAERLAEENEARGTLGPQRRAGSGAKGRVRVSCSNCLERGTNCVDEYAPLKAAKQLRRGKRISEIEMLYGKSATTAAAVATSSADISADTIDEILSDISDSPGTGKQRADEGLDRIEIPDLTREFFESAFFKRFHVQRPILEPTEFVERYFATPFPCSTAMGAEGAVLCHVLYAWAISYGVDEYGRLDIEENPSSAGTPNSQLTGRLTTIDLSMPGAWEVQKERERQSRKQRLAEVVGVVLSEIDACGMMRRPTWDGVRVLLLILPLTEAFSTPLERIAMYEAAVSQVYTLCSFSGKDYDGLPSGASPVNGGSFDAASISSLNMVRIRIYWYTFVHEGITTGLKGGRLLLDDEDLDTMQDSLDNRSLVQSSSSYRSVAKFAMAPINLAMACRLVNKILTGPTAKRRRQVDPHGLKQAWEALERCWEEFETLKSETISTPYTDSEEAVRFCDGWKIFLFEAQNVMRKELEDRLADAMKPEAQPESASSSALAADNPAGMEVANLRHLLDIARAKCEAQTKLVLMIVKAHAGTRFFEWDASLVRDGTFYAAKWLVRSGGSDEDVAVCLHALNELRWAHARAWERSAELRRDWASNSSSLQASESASISQSWTAGLSNVPPLSGPVTGTSSGTAIQQVYTPPIQMTAEFGQPFTDNRGQFPFPGYIPMHQTREYPEYLNRRQSGHVVSVGQPLPEGTDAFGRPILHERFSSSTDTSDEYAQMASAYPHSDPGDIQHNPFFQVDADVKMEIPDFGPVPQYDPQNRRMGEGYQYPGPTGSGQQGMYGQYRDRD